MRTQQHTAMQNVTLLNAINVLLAKYSNIEGDYSSTLIQGVAHFMLDSGIYSDSFSVADAKLIAARTTHIEYDSEEWHEAVHAMQDLQCNNLLAAINALHDTYDDGSKDNTGCSYLGDDIVKQLCEQEDY